MVVSLVSRRVKGFMWLAPQVFTGNWCNSRGGREASEVTLKYKGKHDRFKYTSRYRKDNMFKFHIYIYYKCLWYYSQRWITRIFCLIWINGFYFVDLTRCTRHKFLKFVFITITLTCLTFRFSATQDWSKSLSKSRCHCETSTHNRCTGCLLLIPNITKHIALRSLRYLR